MMRNRLTRIEKAFEDFCDDWEQDLITAIRLLDAERVTGSAHAEGRVKGGIPRRQDGEIQNGNEVIQ